MEETVSKLQQLQDAIIAGNIPQLVLSSISYALDSRASDIHIEPEENRVRIRFRIDGVLRQIVEYPVNLHPAVVSRIKIMSNLKIDEQRIPQDGRTEVTTKDGREMDLRISTLPTVNGEKLVMRIQDKSRKIPELGALGMQGDNLKMLEEALKSPNGIILNTGPTGSGKTTTLYSCLQNLNQTDVNILTIEDPVEIKMDGLNQSQVHHDINYDFATGMRAALRQDPDIIMVGEIRDRETVDIAIESSLTGHLVLSTIHTNSAVETITRILNMGVPPYLVAATMEMIIAQRLVRKVCEDCKEVSVPDENSMAMVNHALENLHANTGLEPEVLQKKVFYHGKGCDKCGGTGYFGRVGIYEVMKINNALRTMILNGAGSIEIEMVAVENGMTTLEQSGIVMALLGQTTLDEVYKVARKMEVEHKEAPVAEAVTKPAEPIAEPVAAPVAEPAVVAPVSPNQQ